MTLSHLYQDFGHATPHAEPELQRRSEEDLAEDKLQSFEAGYKSGWDDAIAAQDSLKGNVSAAFARNIEDAKLAYQDARVDVLNQLQMQIEPLLAKLLPALASKTLLDHILEQIEALATQSVEGTIELSVSPGQTEIAQTLLGDGREDLRVTPDETLLEDQVFVRIANAEREIHVEPFVNEILQSVSQFFDENRLPRGDTE